jgi:hypothetical protein
VPQPIPVVVVGAAFPLLSSISAMWIPRHEAEIVEAAGRPLGVEETMSCDAKRQLPGQNRDLAQDVAAMANEGGVLIYGVGEDATKRAKILKPIALRGVRERVDQIVQTGVAEPPYIEVHAIPTAADDTRGYLVVVVPASPRAPHMVTLGGDNRYYRRTATGNLPMNHLEVEMLFGRRTELESEGRAVLERELARDQEPDNSHAKLYLVARPVPARQLLAGSAGSDSSDRDTLAAALRAGWGLVAPAEVIQGSSGSAYRALEFLRDQCHWTRTVGGWRIGFDADYTDIGFVAAAGTNEIRVKDDGQVRLYCGRVSDAVPKVRPFGDLSAETTTHLAVDRIAEYVARFLVIAGTIYESSQFHGQVDVAVRVSGVEGAIASRGWPAQRPLEEPEYRSGGRYAAQQVLGDWMRLSNELIGPLLDTLSQGRYRPFKSA